MRINNGKRFWPALALAPVLALAVFLTAGLFTAGPAPPAALAQGLPATPLDAANIVTGECGVNANAAADGSILKGGPCVTSGDSLNVVFQNTGAASLNMVVYVTGGDGYPGVQARDISGAATTTAIGRRGVNQLFLPLPAQDAFLNPGKRTVAVSRSLADDTGAVYLFAYKELTNAGIPFPRFPDGFPTAETSPGTDDHLANFAIKVQFVGLGSPDAEQSSLAATDPDLGATESTVTIAVNNRDGGGLTGFMTLTLEGGGDAAHFAVSNRRIHRIAIVEGVPTAAVKVQGLPATGPIRAQVTGVYGSLTLSDYITRTVAIPATVTARAYACAAQSGETGGICANEAASLANDSPRDDPAELVYVRPGGSFLIAGRAADAAGNRVYGALSWAGADADADAALAVNRGVTTAVASPATGPDTATVAVAATAAAGDYSLAVSDRGDNASAAVEFSVAGPPDTYTLAGPERISLSGYGEYTVTATDASGYPPHFKSNGSDRCLEIRVRGARFNEADDLDLLREPSDACTGLLLDAATGRATFIVNAPLAVVHGSEASIQVWLDGRLLASQEVAFANVPENAAVASTAPAMSTVTWRPVFGATVHWIWSVKPDNTGGKYTRAAGDAGSVAIDGLESGSQYYFIVIAGTINADGTVTWSRWSDWTTTTVQ